MTKKLEELFNLDDQAKDVPVVDLPPEAKVKDHTEINSIEESYKAVEKITQDLPQIKELEEVDDSELDNLAKKAENAYDELMDLGMNVEVRYASRIFEVASSMMTNAINAKTAKIDKKLKAVDLQLKKYKIDKDNTGSDDMINGQGYVITDRNELLKKLQQKS